MFTTMSRNFAFTLEFLCSVFFLYEWKKIRKWKRKKNKPPIFWNCTKHLRFAKKLKIKNVKLLNVSCEIFELRKKVLKQKYVDNLFAMFLYAFPCFILFAIFSWNQVFFSQITKKNIFFHSYYHYLWSPLK